MGTTEFYGIILLIGIGITGTILFYLYSRNKRIKEENYYLTLQQSLLKEHYELLQEQIDTERHFRHDLKNHLQTVEALMEMKGNPETALRQYQQDVENLTANYVIKKWSKDSILDVVLHNKLLQCQKESIHVEVEATVDNIRDYDLMTVITILYNLFDNAIEANTKIADVKKRYLKINISEGKGELLLAFENAKAEGIWLKEGQKTTKEDTRNHGMGLDILKQSAKRQGGSVHIEEKETNWSTIVRIKKK